MRLAALFQPLALMAMLFFLGAMGMPVTEVHRDVNIADSGLVERGTQVPSTADDAEIRDLLLHLHNKERWWHHAPPLTWDTTLAAYAQNYSNTCIPGHSYGPYGENLFAISPASVVKDWHHQTKDAVNAWIGELGKYSFQDPHFSEETGHFTQIIWKSSERLGCAWTTNYCDGVDGMVFLFCEYDPPGNVDGSFRDNTIPH